MSSSGAVDREVRARPALGARIAAPPLAPGMVPELSLTAEWKVLADLDAADIEAWRGLVARALEPNVFLEPSFALAAAKHLAGGRNVGALLIRDGARLMGLVPGRIESLAAGRPVPTFVGWTLLSRRFRRRCSTVKRRKKSWALSCKRFPSFPAAATYSLSVRERRRGAVARLRASELARKGISVFALRSAIVRAMSLGFPEIVNHKSAKALGGSHPLASISGGRLKELRRQRRRLGELGVLVRRRITQAPEIAAAIEAYLALEARGWKGRTGGAARSHAAAYEFLRTAVAALAAEGKARIDLLELESKPVAAAITLFSGGRAWFWKIAYDEDYARFSPACSSRSI